MKFIINKESTLHKFKQLLKTCNSKAKGTTDADFLFQAKDGEMYVSSINDKSEQKIKITCELLEGDGSFSVPGVNFYDFINAFPEDKIQCVYNAEESSLLSGNKKTRFAFVTNSSEDFIPFVVVNKGDNFSISSELFKEGLKHVFFSASHDWQNSPLTAIKIDIKDGFMEMLSSDLSRISYFKCSVNTDISYSCLLPWETCEILSSICDEPMCIQPAQKHIKITWSDTTFISVLESGDKSFPDLLQYFEKDDICNIKVSSLDLHKSFKLASLVAKDSNVLLTVDENLYISTNEQYGASKDTVALSYVDGSCSSFYYLKFLMKALEMYDSSELNITFRELKNNSFGICFSNANYKHIIFPAKNG